jgi:cleavage stimulation factor subunit 2
MKQGCSVFVGNIDFDVDEQKVIEELSAVGKVVSFRMYDKNTGKSKGFGFCEYESPLIAETALKTLKISFNGRPVKINHAENDMPSKIKEPTTKSLQIDSIISVLDSFDSNNLKDVIDYLKKMAIDQPSQLKELLDKNRSLVVSILALLVRLNLVDKDRVYSLIESSFDTTTQQDQISERISTINEQDLGEFNEEVRSKILKLKQMTFKSGR